MWLSRKQLWRRSGSCYEENIIWKLKISALSNEEIDGHLRRLEEEEKSSIRTSSISNMSLARDFDVAERTIQSRRVQFSNSVRVVLIPMRDEFLHLFPDLYYFPEDCLKFKEDACGELETYRHSTHCKRRKLILMKRGLIEPPLRIPLNMSPPKQQRILIEQVIGSSKYRNFYGSVGVPLRMHAHTPTWHICNDRSLIDRHEHLTNIHEDDDEDDNMTDHDMSVTHDYTAACQWDIDLDDDEPCTIKEASMILYQPWKGDDDFYYIHTYSPNSFMYSI